ncbi:MAG: VWA domain-containing protein, partial [Candidatus Methylomirabilia bacterium]
MGTIRYSKWTGLPWEDLNAEELLEALADYLLESGFYHPYYDLDGDRSLEELYAAMLQALVHQGRVDVQDFERWLESPEFQEQSELSELLKALLQHLVEEDYVTLQGPGRVEDDLDVRGYVGGFGPETSQVRFEITNKTLDFLGYKTLKDLLGAVGKSDLGRHDTRELSTGIEAALSPKPYEFGDTLNLDVTGTLLNAIERQGLSVPIHVEYQDLLIRQSEYQSSCATVLLLDCSHSMILYGEDRFTPAKRVALALSHLIRTQYPGDSLHVVLFHDSAEEIPLSRLARVTVGPYHTNTKAGLRLAQQILARERKDMRQIVMITDGKPSAITLADGRVYKNPMGLDPHIIHETFREV